MPDIKEKRHMVDILFVLTLFCVFAISALTLVTLGANIYQTTVDHMDDNFTSRTPYSYVTQKIRQADEENSISLGMLDDTTAIVLNQEINHESFVTYLYSYDGYLCELFTRADQMLPPSAGNKIVQIDNLSIEQINEKLYSIDITTSGGEDLHLKIGVRCGNEDL